MAETANPLDVGGLVEAITAAAHDIASLNERVVALEEINRQAELENERLRSHLETVLPKVESAKSELRTVTSAADDAEARAAAHLSHADRLDADLVDAHSDLAAIEAAVGRLVGR